VVDSLTRDARQMPKYGSYPATYNTLDVKVVEAT
jgi:hypothetical protein